MCRFISIAVEDEPEAKRLFGGYSLWKNENKSFISAVDIKFKTLWVTDGHCSCDLYSYPYDPIAEAEKYRKKFSKSKYRKKGWTSDKVEREVEFILSRKSREKGGLSDSLFFSLQNYVKVIGRCYFHLGWYTGDQNKQGINILESSEKCLSSGSVESSEIKEDVLYKFI